MVTIDKTVNNHQVSIESFNTVNDLVNYNTTHTINEIWKNKDVAKSVEQNNTFYNVKTLDEAYSMLNNGWHTQAKKAVIDVKKALTENKTKIKYYNSVVGYSVNIGLYLNGIPTCMINAKKDIKKSKIIHIIYDCTVSWTVTSKEVYDACITLINVINSLQNNGYRVVLDIFSCCNDDMRKDKAHCMLVNVKKAENPLNIDKIMFPITNIAFFRCVYFDWQNKSESCKDTSEIYTKKRGVVFHYTDKDVQKDVKDVLYKYCSKGIYLNYYDCVKGLPYIKKVLGI